MATNSYKPVETDTSLPQMPIFHFSDTNAAFTF